MKKNGYPAPVRRLWHTMIEFNDGQQIVGVDDADVIDAWRRIHWVLDDAENNGGRARFKGRILEHARALHGVRLAWITGNTPDDAYLDALDAEGCITLIRK